MVLLLRSPTENKNQYRGAPGRWKNIRGEREETLSRSRSRCVSEKCRQRFNYGKDHSSNELAVNLMRAAPAPWLVHNPPSYKHLLNAPFITRESLSSWWEIEPLPSHRINYLGYLQEIRYASSQRAYLCRV